MKKMEGKKTYIGIGIALAGMLGVARFFTNVELEILVTNLLEIGGIALAIYGRAVSKGKKDNA